MKLLVADDERDVQFRFQQKFGKEIKTGETKIYYAFNSPTALKLIESFENLSGHLILSDINMPVMDGADTFIKN